MPMAHPMTLPTIAVLSLLGAGLGIHLGNASIAEISPQYFDGAKAGSKFYSDMAPNAPRNWASVQATEYKAAQTGETFHGCVGCRTYPEEYFPVHEASLGKSRTAVAEVVEEPSFVAEPAVMTSERPPQFAQVERYTRYPMTAEEEQEFAAAEAPASDETMVGAAE